MYKKKVFTNQSVCFSFKENDLDKAEIEFPLDFVLNDYIHSYIANDLFIDYRNNFLKFKDLYIRTLADFENFKKRSSDDLDKIRKYAIEDFSENMLFVIDSLEAALIDKSKNIERLLEGVRLTLKLLINTFEKNQIKSILPQKGDKFDPYKHLAISTVKFEDQNNTIVNVLQKGYSIFERIIRPALVVVSKVD